MTPLPLIVLLLASVLAAADPAGTLAPRLVATYVFVGGGSGVVVSADGLVLSNHHVTESLTEPIELRWADGSTAPARLLGIDPVGDLVLLRAEGRSGLPFARLAEPADFTPGAAVLAVGNPFGLGERDDLPTLSQGVLATGRVARGDYADCVQGDAPVNPGNSGGPLFTADGRLLGINGQIRSRTGFRANSGIGLAIAAPQLRAFLPLLQAAEGGYVWHAAPPAGLRLEDGPLGPVVAATAAALEVGDRLLQVAGRPVASASAALGAVQALPWIEGGTVAMAVQRGGRRLDLEVPVGRTPIPGRPHCGWTVEESAGRLRLSRVDGDGPAQRAGLQPREVLLAIDGTALVTRLDLLRLQSRWEIGQRLRVRVAGADGSEREVAVLVRPKP